jgi:putative transport protein
MEPMLLQILIDNPLLTFCIVAALGYLLGRVRIGGSSLGTAVVLFAGLFVGAIDPRLKLPNALYLLGLVLFVYTIGLSSGPAFFAALRCHGVRDNLLIVGALPSLEMRCWRWSMGCSSASASAPRCAGMSAP